ncbi:hypothetical protein EB796_000811 [Bugula neritina]|uniref:CTLH domain-containing protein n=1 Tax=Bugula neritina TaxID=10212 RepID=A0A7J7KRW3_BUGNE|nr:hypothetical protein EB796_000811 [Bugula neritina]
MGAFPLTHKDKDIIRLIGQYLKNTGFEQTADKLVDESGLYLEHPVATQLRSHILAGNWTKAEASLAELHKLLSSDESMMKEMKFSVLKQKYLEMVEDGKLIEAIHCLRYELTPLKFNTGQVHKLSTYVMYDSLDELKEMANWAGKGYASRQSLMEHLQTFLPIHIVLPPKRLDKLLDQAVSHQIHQCKYHNRSLSPHLYDDFSLLTDHICAKDSFPSRCTHILTQHGDQVWFCRFSPDGSLLATGSKDGMIYVWSIDPHTYEFSIKYSLEGHTYGVAHLAWSPDSKHIVACGPDECGDVWIWDIETGELKVRMSHSTDDSLTSVSFHKDARRFVTGGTRGQFYHCDLEGNVLDSWEGIRVHCVGCLNDNKTVLAADSHFRLRSYNFEDLSDQHLLQESHSIVSFTISEDGRLVLLNIDSEGRLGKNALISAITCHVTDIPILYMYHWYPYWDLKNNCMVRKLHGLKQGYYAIHSSFGGVNQDFVASGSEDNKVYIWHIEKESPICALEGHTQTVNCVHWNPANPSMIASVSDDSTIRIWGPAMPAIDSPSTSRSPYTSRLPQGGDSFANLSGRCTPV